MIINKVLEDRSFVIGSSIWNEIEKRLYRDFQSGAAVIFFEMGKACGISIVDGWRKVKGGEAFDQQKAIDTLAEYGTVAGWGKVIVSRSDGREIRVKVIGCIFCSKSDDEVRASRCQFLRGVLSGMAETVFNRPFKVTENYCSKKFCEFTLQSEY